MELISVETGEVTSMPIEDIAVLVLDNPALTLSQSLLLNLNKNNVSVIFCDEKHLPISLLMTLDGNHLQTERFRFQIDATVPVKKNLWQNTIRQKIVNQAEVLGFAGSGGDDLRLIAKKVLSGDTGNQEAIAARRYWRKLFGNGFVRERNGPFPNNWLNYGYAIVRAAMARAIVSAGLLPTLGIHHHNRYNSYCLADDLMEPYRPFVDKLVYSLSHCRVCEELQKEEKRQILSLLSSDVTMKNQVRPMMIAMEKTAFSVVEVFKGERKDALFPEFASNET